MKIKPGDFLLTKEKQLFRIMDVYTDTTGTYYDIKSYKATSTVYNVSSKERKGIHQYIRAIPRNRFRHLGKVIPEDKITKTMKILYG
jgi:hypothetical protein